MSGNAGPFKVEKNVAMPTPRSPVNRGTCKYPFHAMAVGDSFLVEGERGDVRLQQRVLQAAADHRRAHGCAIRIATRYVEGGLRVWRLADGELPRRDSYAFVEGERQPLRAVR